MTRANVAIIGAGIMGSAAADAAANAGQSVVVFEQYPRLHSYGSSTGITRGIRLAYSGPRYIPPARKSLELWKELEAASRRTLLIPTGGLDFGGPDQATLANTIASMRSAGILYRAVSPASAAAEFPGLRIPPGAVAVYQSEAALIRASDALEMLQDRAIERGAEFRFEHRIDSIELAADGSIVIQDDGEAVVAGGLVICAGAWTRHLLANFLPDTSHPELAPHLVRVGFYPFPARPGFPLFYWHNGELPGGGLYGQPVAELGLLKLGLDGGVPIAVPEQYHEEVVTGRDGFSLATNLAQASANQAEPLSVAGAGILPEIEAIGRMRIDPPGFVDPKPMVSRSCLYTRTTDGNFYIHRIADQVVVAAGFSGHGFKFAPLVGEILAAAATGGHGPGPEAEMLLSVGGGIL